VLTPYLNIAVVTSFNRSHQIAEPSDITEYGHPKTEKEISTRTQQYNLRQEKEEKEEKVIVLCHPDASASFSFPS
jgi:hypothetical protein